jgi:hypothetical protein
VDYFREADRNVMRLYFPGQKNYSFSVSGDSPLLVHKCPVAVSTSEYIYVDFEFTDTAFDREEIALYNIFIEKKYIKKGKEKWMAVADNYYYSNNNLHTVRLKNIYPPGEYRMLYGFYLRRDSLNPHPELHKRVCNFEIY